MVFEQEAIENDTERTELVDLWDSMEMMKKEIKVVQKTLSQTNSII